jgi:hypothetical protein
LPLENTGSMWIPTKSYIYPNNMKTKNKSENRGIVDWHGKC